MAFSTVVAFNRFQERGFIHIVAFHRLALVRRGNNLGGISQYDHKVYDKSYQEWQNSKGQCGSSPTIMSSTENDNMK